ncbi:MAG: helix-turn-helix transcriptional regulator [Spirochaetaceae bacterium]
MRNGTFYFSRAEANYRLHWGMRLLGFVAALGAIQGLLLCALIFFRHRSRTHLPLALLLFAFSLRLGTIPSWSPAVLLQSPWLLPATTPLPFLFGPLLWWYMYELCSGGRRPKLLPLHFVPYALGVASAVLGVIVRTEAGHAEFVAALFGGRQLLTVLVPNAAKVGLTIVYLGLAGRILFGRQGRGLPPALRRWAGTLAVASLLSFIPYAYVALDPRPSALVPEGSVGPFVLVAAGMAVLIYTVSLMIMAQPEPAGCADHGIQLRRFTIPEDQCVAIADRARQVLDEGELQNPDLALATLAEQIGVHPNRLSAAMNFVFGMSFRRYINRRRVEYFMERAGVGVLCHGSILDLAMESGFPSKSTFNREFKEITGMTPSEWVRTASRCGESFAPDRTAPP